MLAFIAGICIAVPLAVYLILYEIDPSTHFYYDNAHFYHFQNIFIICVTILMIPPVFIKKSAPKIKLPDKNIPLSVCSVIFAVSLSIYAAYLMLKMMERQTGAGGFLSGLTGFLAAIFFFALAGRLFSGSHVNLRNIALLPVLWGIVNLISTFMSLTSIANISKYVYEIMQLVFGILFFYYNARLMGGVPNGREISGVFAFGLPCAMFGLLYSIPPVVANMINSKKGDSFTPVLAVYLIMSVYIIVLLISVIRNIRKNASEKITA